MPFNPCLEHQELSLFDISHTQFEHRTAGGARQKEKMTQRVIFCFSFAMQTLDLNQLVR